MPRTIAAALSLSLLLLAFLGSPASAAAASVGGNVSLSWSIPNVPAGGLTNITFPMTIDPATAHRDGTYFAQQFNFANVPDVGYTGLQPRPNLNGRERLHGVFSSFQAGTTTTDPNCHEGADGGPGVSCAAEFDGSYGHTYAITVSRTGTDTWSGTATDTVTGQSHHLGTYKLPAGSGNLKSSQGGFVEYYLGSPSCSQLPRIDVVFGGPTSTDAGGLGGTTRANYEYSDCVGQANYQATNVGNGTHVTRGWIASGATVKNAGAGRCLDDPGSNTANGTQIIIYDCHGGANQQWSSTLTIGGKCLDAYAGGTTAGTKAVLWDCHGGTNQQWTFNGDGTIHGVQSGLCLALAGGATANGTGVVLGTCDAQPNQRWTRI